MAFFMFHAQKTVKSLYGACCGPMDQVSLDEKIPLKELTCGSFTDFGPKMLVLTCYCSLHAKKIQSPLQWNK